MVKIFSGGLQVDARRSWMFYIVSGFLIGGLPWLGLAYSLFANSIDFVDIPILFVLPAFLIGAISGGVLKYRLVKLTAATGIENSIK